MADNWAVVRRHNGREVVIFDGTEDDARVFLSNNYPRVHVEPNTPGTGVPDALLKSPAGDYESCVGTRTVGNVTLPSFIDTDENGVPKEDAADEENDNDADDEAVAPAKKTTPAKKTAAPSFGPSSGGNK